MCSFCMVFQCAESTLVSPVQGLQHAFLVATRKGDLDKMKDLIGQGCSVNTTLNQVKFRPESSSQLAAYIYHHKCFNFVDDLLHGQKHWQGIKLATWQSYKTTPNFQLPNLLPIIWNIFDCCTTVATS